MRRTITILSVLFGLATAQADDYPYLTFQTADGSEQSIASSQLVITFADGKLTATSGSDTVSLTLADLSKMYFSTVATAIRETLATEEEKGGLEAFSLAGVSMGRYENLEQAKRALPKGLYVVKGAERTYKIAVR